MRDFGKRVGLVHELRQLAGAEERIYDAGQSLGIDKVLGCEDLVVADVHTLANGTCDTHQTHRELVCQLLADRSYAAVRQVVDIVYVGLRVNELDQVFDDLDYVLARERTYCRIDIQIQLLVDAETTHVAQIVTLVREEQLFDHVASRSLIGRLRGAQLPVNIYHGLLFGVARVFLQRIVYYREVDARRILVMQQNRLGTRLDYLVDMFLRKLDFAVDYDVVTLDRDDLARILVDEVLDPCRQNTRSELAADGLFKICFGDLYLVGQIEDLQYLLVGFVTDRSQQSRYGQLLLTVDVGIHDVVDVRCELYPRTFERDDTRRIELRTVGVHALAEEYARRAVQLRYHDSLRTVEDERTALGHIRDQTEIYVLNDLVEVLVLGVGAVEFKFCFEGNAICQTSLQTLLDRVTRLVDIVVYKFQNEVVSGIRDREIFVEHPVKALVLAVLRRGVKLEKVSE